ncbi:hypothetical protein [Nocardia sp. NBC_01327]|uniref:hypothetical protein n=1 Tax=Nocardia sp. NBC_01327 TaxID=2903593 RepID=UPI002E133BF7|nr:hypothetical protein OG326_42370 [Nocardia sp. NBC_01327]
MSTNTIQRCPKCKQRHGVCITFAQLHQIAHEALRLSDWGRLDDGMAFIETKFLEQVIRFVGAVAEAAEVPLSYIAWGIEHYGGSTIIYRFTHITVTGDALTADGRQCDDELPEY